MNNMKFKLSLKGLERINEINEKYNISCFEIDDDGFWDWAQDFFQICDVSCIISEEDRKYVWDLWNVLQIQ
jgi:uncharacterized protein YlxP (DUF503 family)